MPALRSHHRTGSARLIWRLSKPVEYNVNMPQSRDISPETGHKEGGSAPRVSVIVLNWNGKQLTLDCLRSLVSIPTPNLELVVVGSKSSLKQIRQRKIAEDELMLIVPQNHRWCKRETIRFETLKKEPFIKRESASGTWRAICQSLLKAGYSGEALSIAAEIGNTGGVISGIKNGLGVSVVSTMAVAEELKSGRLKALQISGVELRRSFYLTWNAKIALSPISQALKEFIEAKFPAKQAR